MVVDQFPSELELALRVALAALMGAAIGLEREVTEHPAGMRTHIGVALGACLFGIVSAYGFGEFDFDDRNRTTFHVDPTRVASNIVVGVGFLGGGAILKHGVSVQGLTTAASLWVTAAIGAAIALGSYTTALATGAILFVSLTALQAPSRALARRLAAGKHSAVVKVDGRRRVADVVTALSGQAGIELVSFTVTAEEDEAIIEAVVTAKDDAFAELNGALAAVPGVSAVELR